MDSTVQDYMHIVGISPQNVGINAQNENGISQKKTTHHGEFK